jgi:hypothetical protein
MVSSIVVVELGFFVTKKIISAKISAAQVSLQTAEMEIDRDSSTMQPHFQVFVPQDLLYVPLVSFEAWVQPMEVFVYAPVEAVRRPGEAAPSTVLGEVGAVYLDEFEVSSGEDLNLNMRGKLTITSDAYFAKMIRNGIMQPTLMMAMKGSADFNVRLWGWLPVWLSGVDVEYQLEVKAFDDFKQEAPALKDIVTANGQPGRLEVACTATIFNPSPASVTVRDDIELKVMYQWEGMQFEVGRLRTSYCHLEPGMNVVNGAVTIEQLPGNEAAIKAVATAYLGGVQDGFKPSGTHPLRVSLVEPDDEVSVHSPILRAALRGFDVSTDFRPKPIKFVTRITCDITIAGSVFGWPPKLYMANLYVWVQNPLPQEVRVRAVNLRAFVGNLTGPLVYNFQHNLNPSEYVIPANAEVPLRFQLGLADVAWPGMRPILDLMGQAMSKKITLGIDTSLGLTVMPGYEQEIDYTNNAIYGIICYHVLPPSATQRCGDVGGAEPVSSQEEVVAAVL